MTKADTPAGSAPRSFGWRLWRMRHFRKPPQMAAGNEEREAGRLRRKRAQLHVEQMQHAEQDQREAQGNDQ